jgi:hypothetical protein
MAVHYEIKIKVAYDNAHEVPSADELRANVDWAVGDGLLNDMDSEAVVEEFSVEVNETA